MKFKGILFDLDGTLVNSMASVERAWRAWAGRNGLEADFVMENIHGRPARESVAMLLKDSHEMEVRGEAMWLEMMEATDTDDVVAEPGALALLDKLAELGLPWAIVTSGTDKVARARIKAAGLPEPSVLVTANQVEKGKPEPEPFLLGAEKLGLAAQDCLVFEDSAAGVTAGKAAGAKVAALTAYSSQQELPEADAYLSSLELAAIEVSEQGFVLQQLSS